MRGNLRDKIPGDLPDSFFKFIVSNIPPKAWGGIIKDKPELKDVIMGPFSQRPKKPEKFFSKPRVQERLCKMAHEDPEVLDAVLQLWQREQDSVVAFVRMLDSSFLLENFDRLRDVLGPECFLACLYVTGYCDEKAFSERLDRSFWDRQEGPDLIQFMVPTLRVWANFLVDFGDRPWLENMASQSRHHDDNEVKKVKAALEDKLHKEQKRHQKSREKLERLGDKSRKQEDDLEKYREANKKLRTQLTEWEVNFSTRLEEKMAEQQDAWFSRYKTLEPIKDSDLRAAHDRLNGLLKRAEKALKLQREADEKYGLISRVSEQLLQIELFLNEIERVYRDSLKVHEEIEAVKKALLAERERLYRIPGIEKVFERSPRLRPTEDLMTKLRLLDPIPENLPQVVRYEKMVSRFFDGGMLGEPDAVQDEIEHKKRQIAVKLYERFKPKEGKDFEGIAFENIDEFVRRGRSKKYDVYVDGYNVLLNVQGAKTLIRDTALTKVRDSFIEAVVRRCKAFRRIFLVFDGRGETREKKGNVEIIFSDKDRNSTADSIIIEKVRRRKDEKCVLVTRDNEIIKAAEPAFYALIDPLHFYMFVFDLDFTL